MRLNHVNLCSSDVGELARTLSQHFGYRIIDSGPVHNGEGSFAALVGADGSEIVITPIPRNTATGAAYPPGFHFGLMQDSREAVLAKHAELKNAGHSPGDIHDGFQVWGATWTAFYCPLGDGLDIEINYRTPTPVLDTQTSASTWTRST
ncbi:VOC family protein [Streptomyces sp. NPDC049916]|uniref:VOC family protein n=1 Tax=Streptomyces sp. NPDC049916 TaxID=3155156 RepID=UPI00342135D2